jgi:uncharacterized protein YgbK (DUF1537 family)
MASLMPPEEGGAPFPYKDRAPPLFSSKRVRILADDLTGALDTGAQFSGLIGPVPVSLHGAEDRSSLAFDSATRDEPWPAAQDRISRLGRFFDGADIAYRKIDSLLRGHTLQDIAAGFLGGRHRCCVLAPAFPAQARITRDGIQLFRDRSGLWRPAGPPLADALRALGVTARRVASPAALEGEGVLVCDAATDGDLSAIASAGRALSLRMEGALIWCGSAGLARAVAGQAPLRICPRMKSVLILVGSDHAQSRAQKQSFAAAHPTQLVEILDDGGDHSPRANAALRETGSALITFRLGGPAEPLSIMARIRTALAALLPALERPGGLIVSGGETLRAICEVLGADRLMIEGEVCAGIPAASLVGGLWDGLPVLSKSGAFGHPDILVNLAAAVTADDWSPELFESGEWK